MKIGFSLPMARPIFEPAVERPFGGSEVRGYRFATGLAALGRSVDVLLDASQSQPSQSIDGVNVHYRFVPEAVKSWREQPTLMRRLAAWPISKVRRVNRRLVRWCRAGKTPLGEPLDDALAKIDANLWACFGVHEHAAQVIRYAKQNQLPSILLLASDTDLSPAYASGDETQENAYGQNSADCLYAITNASAIVAQTELQKARLASLFGRDATLIRNPIRLDRRGCLASERLPKQPFDVLWIGRADCFSKRADVAIEVARRCANYRFLMIMNRRDPRTFRRLMGKLPRNVEVVPQVPWREIDTYLASTRLLLNTSVAEGFPNTFLEAAAYGVPIASLTVDPGEMLSRFGCGFCADSNLATLTDWIQGCLTNVDNAVYQSMRSAAQAFVSDRHAAEQRCAELDYLCMQLIQSTRAIRNSTEEAA